MRYLFCVASFLFLPLVSFSQMNIGVKLGANLSSASNIEVFLDGGSSVLQNDATRLGYQFGIWWDIPVGGKQLFLRSELQYIQKSWDWGDRPPNNPYTKFHYLNLPLIVQYQLGNFRIGAGPELSFLADQSVQIDGTNLGDNVLIDEKKLELGANLDLQYNLNRWQFSLRYSLDLTPFTEFALTDVNGEPLSDDAMLKHRALQLSVGYTISNNAQKE